MKKSKYDHLRFIFNFRKTFSGKLDKLLEEIFILNASEGEYVKGLFSRYKAGYTSKLETEKAIRQMKFDQQDPIGLEEAEAIREKLLDNL